MLFSDAGQRGETETLPVIVKTDAEWKQLLSPASYEVTRHATTERPFPACIVIHRSGSNRSLANSDIWRSEEGDYSPETADGLSR